MIKTLLGNEFKYEDDKIYKKYKRGKKWTCCNDLKPNKNGYIRVGVNNRLYYLHRLVYLFHNPDWDLYDISKDNEIDHIDINQINNKIENLRIIDGSGNNRNQEKRQNCSSIYRGVSWNKRRNKWEVRIRIDGIHKHLGLFDDENEASAIYQSAFQEIMEKY